MWIWLCETGGFWTLMHVLVTSVCCGVLVEPWCDTRVWGRPTLFWEIYLTVGIDSNFSKAHPIQQLVISFAC